MVCQWFASDMTVMLFFAQFSVPQFNSTGQAASPVKTDDASPAVTQFVK